MLAVCIAVPAYIGASGSAATGVEPCSGTKATRLEIFMAPAATDSEIARVHGYLDGSPLVERFQFLDKDAAYEEFQRIFRDDPELIAATAPAALPTSFRVVPKNVRAVRSIQRQAEVLPGVDDEAIPDCAGIDPCEISSLVPRLEIYMEVAATESEIAGVRGYLDASRLVKRFEFLDRDAAYEEFQRIFRDDPELIAATAPAALPTSFRVVPMNVRAVRRIQREADALPGVDDAAAPMEALAEVKRACAASRSSAAVRGSP